MKIKIRLGRNITFQISKGMNHGLIRPTFNKAMKSYHSFFMIGQQSSRIEGEF